MVHYLLLFQVQAVQAIRASSMYGSYKTEFYASYLFEEQRTNEGFG